MLGWLHALGLTSLAMLGSWLWVVVSAAPLQLEWVSPPVCHDAARAQSEIALLLGRPPSVDGETPLTVRVVMTTVKPGAWHLTLTMNGPGGAGERSLDGRTCPELSEAAELVIAMAIDPDAVARKGAPVAVVPPAPVLPPSTRSVSEPPPPMPSPVSLRLHAAFIADVGTLPSVAPGLQLGVSLRSGRLQGRLSASLWSAERAAGARAGTGADVSLVCASLRGGLVLTEPLELLVELGADAGPLRGQGVGLDVTRAGAALWAAVIGSASLAIPVLDHVSLRLGAELGATLVSPAFAIDRVGVVHQPSSVFARAWLGAEVSFQ